MFPDLLIRISYFDLISISDINLDTQQPVCLISQQYYSSQHTGCVQCFLPCVQCQELIVNENRRVHRSQSNVNSFDINKHLFPFLVSDFSLQNQGGEFGMVYLKLCFVRSNKAGNSKFFVFQCQITQLRSILAFN